MTTQIDTREREVTFVEDAHLRPMMSLEVLEPLPSARIPYSLVDLQRAIRGLSRGQVSVARAIAPVSGPA